MCGYSASTKCLETPQTEQRGVWKSSMKKTHYGEHTVWRLGACSTVYVTGYLEFSNLTKDWLGFFFSILNYITLLTSGGDYSFALGTSYL